MVTKFDSIYSFFLKLLLNKVKDLFGVTRIILNTSAVIELPDRVFIMSCPSPSP